MLTVRTEGRFKKDAKKLSKSGSKDIYHGFDHFFNNFFPSIFFAPGLDKKQRKVYGNPECHDNPNHRFGLS